MKFKIIPFALTTGIIWGLTILIATVWSKLAGGSGLILSGLNNYYFGFSVSYLGAVIGFAWGFVHGFLAGLVFALLYNAFVCDKNKETPAK